MSTQLYLVALEDHGRYTIEVAADSADEAAAIARTALFEENGQLPADMTLTDRKAEALATLAADQPSQAYLVSATYELDFSIEVPARSRTDAVVYARRIYTQSGHPFEFEHVDHRVGSFIAREIGS